MNTAMTIMEFPALKEANGRLEAKRKELAAIFAEAGPDVDLSKVKSISGDSAAIVEHIRNLNDEMTDLGKEVDSLRAVGDAAAKARQFGEAAPGNAEPGADTEPAARATKSFGELFVKSGAGRDHKGRELELDVEVKALFETGAGWAPETTRGPRLILDEQRPIQLADLIPQTTTNQVAVTYMEETTFTNNAAEAAEGGAYGEAALQLTEKTSSVRKIPVFIPVTDEQLEDEARCAQYLNNRLPFMVRQRLDSQLMAGTGAGVNLRGMLNIVGIQTQAKGVDPIPDAVYKAMTKVQVTGQALPNLVVFHPNDWQTVRLLRTNDGIYIWGNPSETGPEMIWGLRVAKVQAATQGTSVVVDTGFTELAIKRGIEVKVSDSHSDFFVNGKQAVRADMRAAFVVYRPAAICQVTGL